MKTLKMSLANIQGKMSREEMKEVMAGYASAEVTIRCADNTTLTCGCSGNCSCSGHDFGATTCYNSVGEVTCDKLCRNSC